MKWCSGCRQEKPINCFWKMASSPDGIDRVCKECKGSYKRAARKAKKGYYAAESRNRQRRPAKQWADRQDLKRRVIQHYSPEGCCQRCGFSDMRALTLDHINNDGAEHRRRVKNIYAWAWRHRPSFLQVLCMNCQFIRKHAACPHK